jgi:hypothetical protein
MARPQAKNESAGFQIWRVAANILKKESRTADKVWFSRLRVKTLHNNEKEQLVMKCYTGPQTWT